MVTWHHTSPLFWVIETKFTPLYFFANIQWSVALPQRTGVIFPRFSGEHEVDVEHETRDGGLITDQAILLPFFHAKKGYLIAGHFHAFSCHGCLKLYLHFVLHAQKYHLLCRLQRSNTFHLLTASSFFTSLTNVLTFSPRADLDRILLRCFCATMGDGTGDTLLPSADSCTFATEN